MKFELDIPGVAVAAVHKVVVDHEKRSPPVGVAVVGILRVDWPEGTSVEGWPYNPEDDDGDEVGGVEFKHFDEECLDD